MNRRSLLALVTLVGLGICLGTALWASNATTGTASPKPVGSYTRLQVDDSSGNVVLIAGAVGKKTQIWGCTLAALTSKTMEFKSGTTTLTGPMPVNAIQIDPTSSIPWLETISTGDDFTLVLDGATRVCGQILYSQVP